LAGKGKEVDESRDAAEEDDDWLEKAKKASDWVYFAFADPQLGISYIEYR
jgi:hypothetical protein